jgi:GNAT superfamily N-acetyltransferase
MIKPISHRELSKSPEYPALVAEYAAECSIPEIGVPCPQDEMYAAMESAGGLRMFAIYEGANIVGFISLLMYVLPHYGQKVCTTESIFLAAAHRHMGMGAKMLNFIESFAKEQGCKVVLYTAPTGSRFARLLSLNRRRYRRTNSVFCRSL